MKINYQRELDKRLDELKEKREVKKLLLHSCCAPCSSYVLEYLSQYMEITVFYYNPNIYPQEEYQKRVKEQQDFIRQWISVYPIEFLEGYYRPEEFLNKIKGYEKIPEGGERCFRCYELRLEATAKAAAQGGFDFFTTTLSISPMKNAQKLNEIGEKVGNIYDICYLSSDFKKKNGYKRSIELSREYGLYRQDYCGCLFSKEERENKRKEE